MLDQKSLPTNSRGGAGLNDMLYSDKLIVLSSITGAWCVHEIIRARVGAEYRLTRRLNRNDSY